MKKKWFLLLAAVFAVALAACGGTSESAESSSESGISMEEVLAGWSVSSDGGSETVTFPCEKSEKLCGGEFQITWNEAYQDMTLNGMNNANGVTLANWDQYEDNGYEEVTLEYLYLSDPVNVYVEYNDEGARAFMFSNNKTGHSQSIHSLR